MTDRLYHGPITWPVTGLARLAGTGPVDWRVSRLAGACVTCHGVRYCSHCGTVRQKETTMSYTVHLSHAANPDIPGGYYGHKRPAKLKATVPTFADAAKLCREYIDHNELGGGNWTGGQVFKGKEQVARVSYNGRVWPPGQWTPEMQPLA